MRLTPVPDGPRFARGGDLRQENEQTTLLQKAERRGKKYLNPLETQVGGPSVVFRALPRYLTNRRRRSPEVTPGPFRTDQETFRQAAASGFRVTWFGHSSTMLEVDGVRILVDPVWEQRASPFQWTGPKRFFAPTLALAELPKLDVILISHDHYDHLGESTVRLLAGERSVGGVVWVTSKGVGAILQGWGVEASRIVELDWTESHVVTARGRALTITSLPARHFSGRSLMNRFETLWGSFVLEGDRHRVYYGADSGQWPGFAEIGRRYGPFDLTMLEIGAFDKMWSDIHMGPDGAVEVFQEMNSGGLLMPIHWGLFDLALHGWTEPIERLEQLATEQGIQLWSPEPGLPTEVVAGVEIRSRWWKQPSGRELPASSHGA